MSTSSTMTTHIQNKQGNYFCLLHRKEGKNELKRRYFHTSWKILISRGDAYISALSYRLWAWVATWHLPRSTEKVCGFRSSWEVGILRFQVFFLMANVNQQNNVNYLTIIYLSPGGSLYRWEKWGMLERTYRNDQEEKCKRKDRPWKAEAISPHHSNILLFSPTLNSS